MPGGMTETSPLGTYNHAKAGEDAMTPEQVAARRLNQGRGHLRRGHEDHVNDAGEPLPWDGVAFGDLKVRGHWVCSGYYGARQPSGGADADGWFATGDVATIDADGYMEHHRPLKGRDQVRRGVDQLHYAGEHRRRPPGRGGGRHHRGLPPRNGTNARLLLVVPREGRTIDSVALLGSYDGQVPKWWLPDAVLVVGELPHTATGKLNKLALRNSYGRHLAGG